MPIDVNPADLRRIVAALSQCEANAAAALTPAKSALKSAKWNDAQRRKFEEMLNASDKKLKRFTEDSAEMKQFLNKLIVIGEQFLGA